MRLIRVNGWCENNSCGHYRLQRAAGPEWVTISTIIMQIRLLPQSPGASHHWRWNMRSFVSRPRCQLKHYPLLSWLSVCLAGCMSLFLCLCPIFQVFLVFFILSVWKPFPLSRVLVTFSLPPWNVLFCHSGIRLAYIFQRGC